MIGFSAASSAVASCNVEEKKLEQRKVPISLVLRRSSESEEEGPVTMRLSELEAEELGDFLDKAIADGMAVGFLKIEKSRMAISVKDLYLIPFLRDQEFSYFVQQILQAHYPEYVVTMDCPVRIS